MKRLILILVFLAGIGGCASEPVIPTTSGATGTSSNLGMAEGSNDAQGENIKAILKLSGLSKEVAALGASALVQNVAVDRAISAAQQTLKWYDEQYSFLYRGKEKAERDLETEKTNSANNLAAAKDHWYVFIGELIDKVFKWACWLLFGGLALWIAAKVLLMIFPQWGFLATILGGVGRAAAGVGSVGISELALRAAQPKAAIPTKKGK